MCGYELLGFLKSTGELVEDQCPQSQHVPFIGQLQKAKKLFVFRKRLLIGPTPKSRYGLLQDGKNLVHDFSATWRFLGSIHNNDPCVTQLPPPGFAKQE